MITPVPSVSTRIRTSTPSFCQPQRHHSKAHLTRAQLVVTDVLFFFALGLFRNRSLFILSTTEPISPHRKCHHRHPCRLYRRRSPTLLNLCGQFARISPSPASPSPLLQKRAGLLPFRKLEKILNSKPARSVQSHPYCPVRIKPPASSLLIGRLTREKRNRLFPL